MKICVVGGGAAGMLAAIMQAEKGNSVDLYEKNEKLGKKLFITGKGRCNITNDSDVENLLKNVASNSKFMYSAFYHFNAQDTMDYFRRLGLKLKVERGNRVFPESDHSSDVIRVLQSRMKDLGVNVHLNTEVKRLLYQEEADEKTVTGLLFVDENGKKREAFYDLVVVATGGLSYPRTGSTGDGIRWAKELGLQIVEPAPSLVPFEMQESFCRDLMGLSLKNVQLTCYAKVKNKDKDKVVFQDFGEMLFTHFGISGPLVLSASAYISKYLDAGVRIGIDLKPALSKEQLDARLLREFKDNPNKQFQNVMGSLLPKRLIPIMIDMTGVDPYKKVNEVSREERQALIQMLKEMPLTLKGLRGFDEAIITKGGVSVKEINPQNMQTKKVRHLAFVGEVLDVDALTGGFNLQIAWSTAATLEIL